MNQEIQPLFKVDAMKVAVGGTPDPEVAALAKRRQFSAAYKRRIVRAVNACQVPGEIGALLRREGLYSSHLALQATDFLAPGRRQPIGPSPFIVIRLGHPITDRLCRGIELPSQRFRVTSGSNQLDHLPPKLRRVHLV